jgi:hypothetical protein
MARLDQARHYAGTVAFRAVPCRTTVPKWQPRPDPNALRAVLDWPEARRATDEPGSGQAQNQRNGKEKWKQNAQIKKFNI